MTRRLVRACENPHVNMIGHPTARMIGRRPAIGVDLDEVFAAAARTGTAIEINASPKRLDLPSEDILRARRYGVTFAITATRTPPPIWPSCGTGWAPPSGLAHRRRGDQHVAAAPAARFLCKLR
jgi:hypothetical protein